MRTSIRSFTAYVNDTNYDVGYAEKINCYGVSDMRLDVGSLEAFCDDTGVSNLSQCFKELRQFTDALLDRDLGMLCEEVRCSEREFLSHLTITVL